MKRDVNMKRYQEALREQRPQIETDLLQENFFKTLKNFNSMKRKKERLYWRHIREALRLMRTKEFWKRLDTKRKGIPFDFNKNELYEYFTKLSGSQNTDYENSDDSTSTEQEEESCTLDKEIFDILNRVISTEEVKKKLKRLSQIPRMVKPVG